MRSILIIKQKQADRKADVLALTTMAARIINE